MIKRYKRAVIFTLITVSTLIASVAFGEKTDKNLAKKMAVATYYEPILKQQFGMAMVSVKGTKNEALQISLVSVTSDRIQSILDSGVYREAKKAKFKQVRFIDANQNQSVIQIQ